MKTYFRTYSRTLFDPLTPLSLLPHFIMEQPTRPATYPPDKQTPSLTPRESPEQLLHSLLPKFTPYCSANQYAATRTQGQSSGAPIDEDINDLMKGPSGIRWERCWYAFVVLIQWSELMETKWVDMLPGLLLLLRWRSRGMLPFLNLGLCTLLAIVKFSRIWFLRHQVGEMFV